MSHVSVPTPAPALSDTHTVSRNATSGHPHEAPWPNKPCAVADCQAITASRNRNHGGVLGAEKGTIQASWDVICVWFAESLAHFQQQNTPTPAIVLETWVTSPRGLHSDKGSQPFQRFPIEAWPKIKPSPPFTVHDEQRLDTSSCVAIESTPFRPRSGPSTMQAVAIGIRVSHSGQTMVALKRPWVTGRPVRGRWCETAFGH